MVFISRGGWRHTWVPPHIIFVGQGPRDMPVRWGKRIPQSALLTAPFRQGGQRPLSHGFAVTACPPSCQPIPGHCCGRQSGHFLEIASLLPPLAALRRFPLTQGSLWGRIATASVRTGLAMTWGLHGVRGKFGGGVRAPRPTHISMVYATGPM